MSGAELTTLEIGETQSVEISANQTFCATNLLLEADATYEIRAEGEWNDASIVCDAEGPLERNKSYTAYRIADLIAPLDRFIRGLFGREPFMSRRHREWGWFVLIGCIEVIDAVRQSSVDHKSRDCFRIGHSVTVSIKHSGHLLTYPNDGLGFYANNSGTLTLHVTRTG